MRKSFVLLASLLALTACSGEPSESALRKSLDNEIKAQLEQAHNMAKAFGGEAMAKSLVGEFKGIERFEKKECTAVPEKSETYTCTFNYVATLGGDTRNADNVKATFIKTDNGWKVTDFNG